MVHPRVEPGQCRSRRRKAPQIRSDRPRLVAQAGACPITLRRCVYDPDVTTFRVREAADLLGVSDDTVRRWIDAGRLASTTDAGGRNVVAGAELAAFAQTLAATGDQPALGLVRSESARNRFVGLVTRVVRDTVMAQVEIQAGPFRLVSLMSREAADELGLEVGVRAVATVKATQVSVDVP